MHAAGLLRQAEASVCPLDTQPVIKECFQLNLDAVITASTKYYEEITFRRHSAVGKAGGRLGPMLLQCQASVRPNPDAFGCTLQCSKGPGSTVA